MSEMNGADALVRMLQLHGVKHVFGLCGDTSLPFYDALARLDHGMQHILTRDTDIPWAISSFKKPHGAFAKLPDAPTTSDASGEKNS